MGHEKNVSNNYTILNKLLSQKSEDKSLFQEEDLFQITSFNFLLLNSYELPLGDNSCMWEYEK